MSSSTKSKPASQTSPATGGDSKGPFRKEDPERAPIETVEIDLEVSRQRWIAWTIGGTVGGALLIWKLGTVGVWAGYVLIALGLFRCFQLVMSLVHKPGTFIITPKTVTLPRGAHRPNPLVLEPSAVTAVYFLRRSVPWNRSAPVLIVELGDKAMVYPRDWFASEADQRNISNALLSHLPSVRRESDTEPESKPESRPESKPESKTEPAPATSES
jgi:hypothetical protein